MLLPTHSQEPIMQHNRMKAADPSVSTQQSLYRLLLQQQQQQETAGLRLGRGGFANFSGSLPTNPSSLGLGSFALPNYPSMSSGSSLALSRQQLLQSLIAAEEREILQRRLALEEQLVARQQQQAMNYSPPPPQQSFMPALLPTSQEFPSTNIQVESEEVCKRKRSFDEITYKPEQAEQDQDDFAEARQVAAPVTVDTPEEPARVESTPQLPESSVKSTAESPRKAAPKKKSPKKSQAKRSDNSVASEPKKDTKWLNMLEELKSYKAKYGNCIVPRGYSPNPRLARWVAEQRYVFSNPAYDVVPLRTLHSHSLIHTENNTN